MCGERTKEKEMRSVYRFDKLGNRKRNARRRSNRMKRVDGLGIERICDTYTGDIRRERVDLALLAAPVRKAGQDVFGV